MHPFCQAPGRTLQGGHNERDGISNHQRLDCLLNRLFRHRSKKTSKLSVTGLCEENSPVTSEFPAQRIINAENVPFDDVIIYANLNRSPPTIYKRPLATLWLSFMVDYHICPVSVSLCPRGSDFSNCTKGRVVSDLCCSHSSGSCRFVQISILNKRSNHSNQYPACNYWNYCSACQEIFFSYRDIEN